MMPSRTCLAALAAALVMALVGATPAVAAPPPNDSPAAAGEFRVITAENGTPTEREATGELVEAGPDAGVPRCLGPASFERTIWFRVPAAEAAREISVEASGRTTDVLDLAAFVQPPDRAPGAPLTEEANACAGVGSGGADASEEPTAGVTLRVPGGRAVLVQIGRRGARGSAEDERVLLSLGESNLPASPPPAGDVGDGSAPTVGTGASVNVNRSRGIRVRLRLRGGPLCGGRIALVGPRGRTYASTRGSLRALRPRVRLRVVRRLVPATYRLRVTAISQPGKRRVRIRSTGRLRLR